MGRRLRLEHAATTHTLDRDEVTIGRDPACHVMLRDDSVSLAHATIGRSGGEYLIRTADDATNGISVTRPPAA